MTRTLLGLRIASTTLAGVMTLYLAGCSKVEDAPRAPTASTTIGTEIDDSVKSADIAAVTRDGVVQLSGFVNNQPQIDRALAVAGSIKGVVRINNEMTIKQ